MPQRAPGRRKDVPIASVLFSVCRAFPTEGPSAHFQAEETDPVENLKIRENVSNTATRNQEGLRRRQTLDLGMHKL